MKKVFLIALAFISVLSFRAEAQTNGLAGLNPIQSTNRDTAVRMAPHLLRSVPQDKSSDSVCTRTWAYLLLRMPRHATDSLGVAAENLDSSEKALLVGDIARLTGNHHTEIHRFMLDYMPLIESSNKLFDAHIRNLQTVAGGGLVTNEPASGNLDLRSLSHGLDDKPIAVLYLPRAGLAEMISNGAFEKFAVQKWVVAELRRQAVWQLVVVISNRAIKPGFMMHILSAEPTSKSRIIYPSDQLLNGNDDDRQTAIENFTLDALNINPH